MNKSIFKIQEDYLELMHTIDELDGELTPELEQELAINIDEFDDKMNKYADLIAFLNSQIQMNKDRIAALSKLADTSNNLINRLKSNMKDAIQLYGDTGKSGNKTLDTGEHKFYTRKNEVVKIDNLDLFIAGNDEYVRCKITENFDKTQLVKLIKAIKEIKGNDDIVKYTAEPNKSKIKKELKDKVEIDGAMLIRNDSLIIK